MKTENAALLAWSVIVLVVFVGTYLYQGDYVSALGAGGLVAFGWIATAIGNYIYGKKQKK